MAAFRKFKIRAQKFDKSKKRGARIGLVSQRRITIQGKTVKPGQGIQASSSQNQLKNVIVKKTK